MLSCSVLQLRDRRGAYKPFLCVTRVHWRPTTCLMVWGFRPIVTSVNQSDSSDSSGSSSSSTDGRSGDSTGDDVDSDDGFSVEDLLALDLESILGSAPPPVPPPMPTCPHSASYWHEERQRYACIYSSLKQSASSRPAYL